MYQRLVVQPWIDDEEHFPIGHKVEMLFNLHTLFDGHGHLSRAMNVFNRLEEVYKNH